MDRINIIEKINKLIEDANTNRFKDCKATMDSSLEALSLSEKIDYPLGRALSLYRLSEVYVNTGNYSKALDILFISLDFFIKEGILDLQLGIYILFGVIFFELGDYERSMEFYTTAETVAKEIDTGKNFYSFSSTKSSMVIVLNNIAEIYNFLKDYKEAFKYYYMAYKIDKKLAFSSSKGVILLSLGQIYYLTGSYYKASIFTHKSLKYMEKYNYKLLEAEAYKFLGLIYWKKNDLIKAQCYFEKAMNFNEEESAPYYRIDLYIHYYKFLEYRKDDNGALKALQTAYDLSIGNNLLEKAPELAALLAKFHERLGDYQTAYKYFKMYYEYEKTFLESLHKLRINSISVQKKIQQIENEKRDMAEKNQRLRIKSEELKLIVENISIISALGQKITATLNLSEIVEILHSSIKTFMNIDLFGIGLYHEENAVIEYLDVMENEKRVKKPSTYMSNKYSFFATCIKSGKVIIINDLSTEFPKYLDEETYDSFKLKSNFELNSLIFCPLFINNEIIGVMTVQSREKNAITAYSKEMIKSLSSYAAIAVNNAIKSMELEKEIHRRKIIQQESEELNEKLLHLSENDAMTGIANRRKFDSYFNTVWDSSVLAREYISLILLDIDYFKEYNDNYGHIEGDNCIIKIADALSSFKELTHFVSRYGGDEFIIILPNCALETALTFSNNLKNRIATLHIIHEFSEVSDIVTCSIGVTSIIPHFNITINEFIRKADNALYLAKERGRNQIASINEYNF
ncbi:MAG: diguanylate cyclase [Clostridiaceae bacterium]|nr:diguanylate cyclase [Clostridiaceae bacterium]